MHAETEAAIEASRAHLRPSLRHAMENDETQVDYADERAHGWSLGDGLSSHE
jgi:hypothetical protein